VTVRGTCGLEMACFGKPVFTAGTGNYSGMEFTFDSKSAEEFLEKLARIETFEPLSAEMRDRARRYAHAFFVRHPWQVTSFELTFDFPDQGWHPLDRNVHLTVHSDSELRRNGDLDEWVTWVLDTRKADFIASRAPNSQGDRRT
jgi:hypothetical protein